MSTGNNCWRDVFCTFLLSVLITFSHHAMVCVDKCFQGMVKREGNHQLCDLVRGTEEFKASGSKDSSATPFPCVNKSMNGAKKQNVGRGCKKIPCKLCCWWNSLPSVPRGAEGQSSPAWEWVTSWECSLKATGSLWH